MTARDDRGRNGTERIREAAYELFTRHGVRAVGVDTVVEHAGAAKMTLYRNFASKEELILDFLRRREEIWTESWLRATTRSRTELPGGRLLAIFDLFDEWFGRDDFEGCSFLTTMIEVHDPRDPVHQASVHHLARIRAYLRELAAAAGIDDPDTFARQWHILMKGSIMAAHEGDRGAARAAREVGRTMLVAHGVAVE